MAAAVFGGGGFYTYKLFLKPEIDLKREKESPVPPPPAFVDTTVGEFTKCVQVEEAGDPLAARSAYTDFLNNYPDSSKVEDAKFRLGAIQLKLLFAPRLTPGKQAYVVKQGDVINKLSHRLKVSPELLMTMNQLESSNLRVGQRLLYVTSDFSVTVDRTAGKVVVFKGKEFFAQAPILAFLGNAKPQPPKKGQGVPQPVSAKVMDKPGFREGQRLAVTDKGYREALHWIVIQPGGHTIYAEPGEGTENVSRPSSGYGLEPETVRLLSALLRKNDAVSIR